jgi:hypothetical protein
MFSKKICTFLSWENIYTEMSENSSLFTRFGLHDSKRHWPNLTPESQTCILEKELTNSRDLSL